MSTRIITTTSIGLGVRVTLSDDEDLYVAKGVTVGSEDADAVNSIGNLHRAVIDGTIVGDQTGLLLGITSLSESVDDTVTGHVLNTSSGGQVLGMNGFGAVIVGYNNSVSNQGYIYGAQSGLEMGGVSGASQSSVNNSATIEGERYGLTRYSLRSTETLAVENTGEIKGVDASFYQSGANAVEKITNNGSMIGDVLLEPHPIT